MENVMNEWKKVWNNKTCDEDLSDLNFEDLLIKMKIMAGYDSHGQCKISYASFCKEYYEMIENLSERNGIIKRINSIYEIGCGSGANLLLAQRDKMAIGGVDYSTGVIDFARKVFGENADIINDEAIHVPVSPKYDVCVSNGVFPYFVDEDYASKVLDIMLEKSNLSMGILHLHDKEREKEIIEYNRNSIRNYDERYINLQKTFYSKDFFYDFAMKNGLHIKITLPNLACYWNNNFVYNVFMYKF